MLLSSKQKAQKGLNYLEEAILEVLKKVSPKDMHPAEITRQLAIDPLVTSTGAHYSAIVIKILEMLEEQDKVEAIIPGTRNRRWRST